MSPGDPPGPEIGSVISYGGDKYAYVAFADIVGHGGQVLGTRGSDREAPLSGRHIFKMMGLSRSSRNGYNAPMFALHFEILSGTPRKQRRDLTAIRLMRKSSRNNLERFRVKVIYTALLSNIYWGLTIFASIVLLGSLASNGWSHSLEFSRWNIAVGAVFSGVLLVEALDM
jgi:hypothetical protein